MNEVKRDVGREILEGLRELKRGEHGRVINVPDVIQIRKQAGLSQVQFAELLGVSVRTLQGLGTGASSSIRRRPYTADDRGQEPSGGIGRGVRRRGLEEDARMGRIANFAARRDALEAITGQQLPARPPFKSGQPSQGDARRVCPGVSGVSMDGLVKRELVRAAGLREGRRHSITTSTASVCSGLPAPWPARQAGATETASPYNAPANHPRDASVTRAPTVACWRYCQMLWMAASAS